jgi:hypothetical protein
MWMRLARRLRERVELDGGELRERLDRLLPLAFPGRRRVRLYVAPDLAAPVSFGLLRPAIAVPPRALTELSGDEQETMLAHELAHLARRDPLWLSIAWLVERVFFFQPLNRIARAELHDAAELLCDDWAVARTGQRLALASCLARIAQWIVGAPRALPATSMAEGHGRCRLTQRIERLLEDDRARDERPRRWTGPAAAGALSCLVLVVPGVGASLEPRECGEVDGAGRCYAPDEDEGTDGDATSPELDEQGASASLAADLDGLDESISLLAEELSGVREIFADLDPNPALQRTLDVLDARTRQLELRSAELRSLVHQLDADDVTGTPPPGPFSLQGP